MIRLQWNSRMAFLDERTGEEYAAMLADSEPCELLVLYSLPFKGKAGLVLNEYMKAIKELTGQKPEYTAEPLSTRPQPTGDTSRRYTTDNLGMYRMTHAHLCVLEAIIRDHKLGRQFPIYELKPVWFPIDAIYIGPVVQL